MGPVLAGFMLVAGTEAEPYPVDDVLNAAKAGCEAALGDSDSAASLVASGWRVADVKAGGWIEKVLTLEKAVSRSATSPSQAFQRQVSGRNLVLFVNDLARKGERLRLCSVQDPSAEIGNAGSLIVKWAGRPPTSPTVMAPNPLEGFDNPVFIKNWVPGLSARADDSTIRYVPLQYGGSDEPNTGLTFSSERISQVEQQ